MRVRRGYAPYPAALRLLASLAWPCGPRRGQAEPALFPRVTPGWAGPPPPRFSPQYPPHHTPPPRPPPPLFPPPPPPPLLGGPHSFFRADNPGEAMTS